MYSVTNFHRVIYTNKVIIVVRKHKKKKRLPVPKLRCENLVEMYLTEIGLQDEYRRHLIIRSFVKFWKFVK